MTVILPGEDPSEEWIASQRALARKNLFFFAKAICGFDDISPGFHQDLCRWVERTEALRVRMVLVPRGHFKTSVITQARTLWRVSQDPNVRILLANEKADNARKFLRKIRAIVGTSRLFGLLFSGLLPTTQSGPWSDGELQFPRSKIYGEPTIQATGVDAEVTSQHFNEIIADDLIGRVAATSEPEMARAIDWWDNSEPLLEVPERDKRILIGTRWSFKDLYSHVEEREGIGPDDRRLFFRKAIQEGRPIFPERFTLEGLQDIRERDPFLFSTQYLNDPIDRSNVVFEEAWLKYYTFQTVNGRPHVCVEELPEGDDRKRVPLDMLFIVVAVDPALSLSKRADRTAIVSVGQDRWGRVFVLDTTVGRYEPHETGRKFAEIVARFKPAIAGLENVAFQKVLKFPMEDAMRRARTWASIKLINQERMKTKEARIASLATLFSQGCLYVRRDMSELIDEEFLRFPHSRHDDTLDAMEIAVNKLLPPLVVGDDEEGGKEDADNAPLPSEGTGY